MLTQEAIFIATIKGTSLVIKTRPLIMFCKCMSKTAVKTSKITTDQPQSYYNSIWDTKHA